MNACPEGRCPSTGCQNIGEPNFDIEIRKKFENLLSGFFFIITGTRDGDKKDKSPSNADSKTPVIRKGFEVDKFGFYHAQPVQAAAAASSSSSYETSKSRH